MRPRRRTKNPEEPTENEVGAPRMIMIEVGVAKANIDHVRALLRTGDEGKMVMRKRMNLDARGMAIKAVAGDEKKTIISNGLQHQKSTMSLFCLRSTMVTSQELRILAPLSIYMG